METATDSGPWRELIPWTRRHRIWSRAAPVVPAGLFVLTWIASTGPIAYWQLLWPAIVGWICYTLAWLLLLAVQVIRRFFRNASFRWRPWLYLPVFLLVTVITSWARAPFWLGYLASRPAMDSVAHDVMTGKRDPSKIRWIGVYPVNSAWRSAHGFAFYVNGTGQSGDWNNYYDEWGFLYSETRPRDADYGYCGSGSHFLHVTGHWYRVQAWQCDA
jgi:hypothetical protein